MKLLAVVLFGYLALASSHVSSSHHHSSHKNNDDSTSGRHGHGLNGNQDQASLGQMHQIYDNQNVDGSQYNPNQAGQNDEYSESNWNAQTRDTQNKNIQNGQEYNRHDGSVYGSLNRQNNQESYQQNMNKNWNNNYRSTFDLNSGSSESNSQEDYVKSQNGGDISQEIGRKVAQKMVKFFNIIEKFAARNGTVQTSQAQDTLALRQWALPMAQHQFINMVDSKVNGLDQGLIKAMLINTEKNNVDLEYFFNSLLVKGNLKASMGPKGSFKLMMINTNVNVSTELQNLNRNRNFAHTDVEQTEIDCQNTQDSTIDQSIKEDIENKYVQFVSRAIESEMIDNTYNGLVKCLKSEIESTLDMTLTTKSNLVVENKKSQLTVTLAKRNWRDEQGDNKQRKVQYIAFRQNKSGNGYKLKVKVVLAKQPTWEADVTAQKGNQQITIKNVNFHAQNVVATAIMERVQQQNGSYKLIVEDASVKYEGLRFDIGKFDLTENMNENLAREVGQNLHKILENGMSAALQQQLYQQQQICQQNPMDCIRCNQINEQ